VLLTSGLGLGFETTFGRSRCRFCCCKNGLAYITDFAGQSASSAAPPVRNWEDFVVSMFYCLHAVAGGNCRIRFMDKTLEFSSTVLPALLPYISGADVLL